MSETTHGLILLVRSRKFYSAMMGTIFASLPIAFSPAQTQAEKLAQWTHYAEVVGGLWGAVIVMGGVEDAAQKFGQGGQATPIAPVEAATAAANTQAPAVPAFGPLRDPPIWSTKLTKSSPVNPAAATNPQPKAPPMRGQIKLPLVLLALLLPVFCLTGCATVDPQLDSYREGLHAVDEPLYQAHLTLVADAVKAGIRQPAELQIVQAGITQAESLYQQSKTTEAAGALGATAAVAVPAK